MIKINEKSIFSSLIFLFALILLINTVGMRSDVMLVPRLIGVSLLILSCIQMLNDLFPAIKNKLPFLNKSVNEAHTIGGEGVVDDESETKEEANRRFRFMGWMALFVLLIYLTSMIWAIVISVFIYLKWISKESWKMSVLYSFIAALVVYLAFVVGLDVYYFL
jgi:hypothetical protein